MDNALDGQGAIRPGEVDVAASPRRHLEVWLPMVIVTVDQATKAMIKEALTHGESMPIIPGLVNFTHVLNSGAAFGFLNGVDFPFKTVVIAVVATAALIGVGFYAASMAHHQVVARVGLALNIGGAAGNLIDRVLFGSVVDFVDVYWGNHHFWAFNVADSAISVGVAMMILDMLTTGTHVSKTV